MMWSLLLSFPASILVSAADIPTINLVKDSEQYKACKAGDPETTFTGIRYGDGPPETIRYNQCVPWRRNGEIIANAVFCRPATCHVFADENCEVGPTIPVPVIVPISADLLNAADFVELLGQSAYCSPNTIPLIP